jgi:hypothetical protein
MASARSLICDDYETNRRALEAYMGVARPMKTAAPAIPTRTGTRIQRQRRRRMRQ